MDDSYFGFFAGSDLTNANPRIDPGVQIPIGVNAVHGDHNPPGHRPASPIKLRGEGKLKSLVITVGADPYNERVRPESDAYITAQQKAESAEHLSFRDTPLANEPARTRSASETL